MVKFVVDVDRRLIYVGGGLHSDEEEMLLDDGSQQKNLWGANLYLERPREDRLEYTSMINIRSADGNAGQLIQSETLRERVRQIAQHFFPDFL